jgi:hypothetical protein
VNNIQLEKTNASRDLGRPINLKETEPIYSVLLANMASMLLIALSCPEY